MPGHFASIQSRPEGGAMESRSTASLFRWSGSGDDRKPGGARPARVAQPRQAGARPARHSAGGPAAPPRRIRRSHSQSARRRPHLRSISRANHAASRPWCWATSIPSGRMGTLERMPFRVDDGGRAFGPGIFDMKASLVMFLTVMEKLETHVARSAAAGLGLVDLG